MEIIVEPNNKRRPDRENPQAGDIRAETYVENQEDGRREAGSGLRPNMKNKGLRVASGVAGAAEFASPHPTAAHDLKIRSGALGKRGIRETEITNHKRRIRKSDNRAEAGGRTLGKK